MGDDPRRTRPGEPPQLPLRLVVVTWWSEDDGDGDRDRASPCNDDRRSSSCAAICCRSEPRRSRSGDPAAGAAAGLPEVPLGVRATRGASSGLPPGLLCAAGDASRVGLSGASRDVTQVRGGGAGFHASGECAALPAEPTKRGERGGGLFSDAEDADMDMSAPARGAVTADPRLRGDKGEPATAPRLDTLGEAGEPGDTVEPPDEPGTVPVETTVAVTLAATCCSCCSCCCACCSGTDSTRGDVHGSLTLTSAAEPRRSPSGSTPELRLTAGDVMALSMAETICDQASSERGERGGSCSALLNDAPPAAALADSLRLRRSLPVVRLTLPRGLGVGTPPLSP